jgi:hypothetical protein
MTGAAILLCAGLAVAPAPAAPGDDPSAEETQTDGPEMQPDNGTGVSPIELIPRLELRHRYVRQRNASLHFTILRMDVEFLRRALLRYDLPLVTVNAGGVTSSGLGDIRVGTIVITTSNAHYLTGVVAGLVLDTASRPALGAGKQQVYFGAGAVYKPAVMLLVYGLVQDQLSFDGDAARADIHLLSSTIGAAIFGRQRDWLAVSLDPTYDFKGDHARLAGDLEAGRLLVGRVGLFLNGGTQLLGQRQVSYQLEAGVRYLFRLERPSLR